MQTPSSCNSTGLLDTNLKSQRYTTMAAAATCSVGATVTCEEATAEAAAAALFSSSEQECNWKGWPGRQLDTQIIAIQNSICIQKNARIHAAKYDGQFESKNMTTNLSACIVILFKRSRTL